jgi:transposase
MRGFNAKHGNPGEVLVCVGDFSIRYRHMRHHAPKPISRVVRRFQKAKHKVRLVNEFYTSKRCCSCKLKSAECEKFFEAPSRRPWRRDYHKLNALVKCGSCGMIYDRDRNASVNMVYAAVGELVCRRPEHLQK